MQQFLEFFRFELKFRFKSISTYVYFAVWFAFEFLCIASESFGPVGNANGKVLLNGPYASLVNDIGVGFFGIIVIAAIFGTSILRDFQRDMVQILFTKPISKIAYLGGRWAGSFVACVFAFSGLIFGGIVGSFAPWADQTRIAPIHLGWFLQPFVSLIVVEIFFLGSLFFLVAALSRRIFIVYLQGAAIFVIYLLGVNAFSATRSLDHFWSGILDPVGFLLLNAVTRYWTVAEKNTQLLSWSMGSAAGVFLLNRLLWSGVGALSLVSVWRLFPMSVEALTARAGNKRAKQLRDEEKRDAAETRRSQGAVALPAVATHFTMRTTAAQFSSLTRIRISNIVREAPFWVLLFLMAALAINNGHFAGRTSDANVWPVTYLMVSAVEGIATLFLFIIATLYAAELVWRERDTGFAGIHDALPVRDWVDSVSRLVALCFVEIALLLVVMLCGMLMQTIAGYHHYEVLEYLKELYLVTFPQVMIFALFAFFVQTLVSNKFIGHGIVVGVFVMVTILFNFGWENTLYLFGNVPPYIYSDMNGYGHFVPIIFWATAYWLSFAAVLFVLSMALSRRGAEDSLRARLSQFGQRFAGVAAACVVFALMAVGSGAWYYYNGHVLNSYVDGKTARQLQASYERSFKKYEHQPQLKITAVDAQVDIYPERRSFSAVGHYQLENKTTQPISEIHISDAHAGVGTVDVQPSITDISFDHAYQATYRSTSGNYTIYTFDKPIAPGELVQMTFRASHTTHGFRDGHEQPEFAYSGTFFDAGYFPTIGYDNGVELTDPRRRREEHLPELEQLPHRGDARGSVTNLFSPQADWISYHTTVSTSDVDSEGKPQIAVAPGYLTKEWHANGRHYFTYDMGTTQVADFYAYLSARYEVKRDVYQGVNGPIAIEVYHDPAHNYDVDDMITASKAGLAYYEKNFSPYQFRQYRILEYPRYRTFAQSFPNTVPFSEGIGFIGRVEKPDDIDFTYFVVAHELAHQWWGHQLIGAQVEGSNMMSESLAEYSALRVMEKKYGEQNMHKFLSHELDGYLRGRAGEIRHENPLVLVQNEAYVWYQKGSLVMYALSDYIGEDKLNLALHNFLMQYRYANAGNGITTPYPDTRQFVAALRTQTPPELQYYITDAFENIVLYDNKALSATYVETPDHKYKVTLKLQARKMKADGSGNESEMALRDYIDVGVFSGTKDHETPLYLAKRLFTTRDNTVEIVVDQRPTRAGIDPMNKLIDRVSDDNETDVTKQ